VLADRGDARERRHQVRDHRREQDLEQGARVECAGQEHVALVDRDQQKPDHEPDPRSAQHHAAAQGDPATLGDATPAPARAAHLILQNDRSGE
jgi:hypothetical protein